MSFAFTDVVAVIGGGPAGLMAAERLALEGLAVVVFDAKPSLGRKFLRAGIGGLNLTHAEDHALFCSRFEEKQEHLQPMLDAFTPDHVRAWAAELGVGTFEGSSGRVFPTDMKAAPLLRAWVQHLRGQGVRFRLRHRWQGWSEDGSLQFDTPEGPLSVKPRATVLALGGGSWPQLGSDGAWLPWLDAAGVKIAPLRSANCGFEVQWSPYIRDRFAGAQLKSVAMSFTDSLGRRHSRAGELVISEYGIEGSLVYHFSKALRDTINAQGNVQVHIDLAPGRTQDKVLAEVAHPRGARSMSSHLQSRLSIKGVKAALLREVLPAEAFNDSVRLAQTIKDLPIILEATRPVAEAISTAGGVCFDALDPQLMLKAVPGVFVAGEMVDWEAPTGGYLLTACLAQGAWAASGVTHWLKKPTLEP